MAKKKIELEDVDFKDKIKSSYYVSKETEERLMEIYVKRMKEGERPRKSSLIEEAVLTLHQKEFQKPASNKTILE